MTDPKLLLQFFDEIPVELQNRAVIAGGAVLDLRKCTDIDIFILNCQEFDELNLVKASHQNKFSDISDEESSDKKAVTFTGKIGKKINVICDEAETVDELLSSFDISTSRIAVDNNASVTKGEGFTLPGTPITVFYCSKTTPERIQKYCARFGTGWLGTIRNTNEI